MSSHPSESHLCTSPKRKRGEWSPGTASLSPAALGSAPTAPRIVTDLRKFAVSHVGEPDDERGDGSPRSVVAGQLQDLTIQGAFDTQRSDAGPARKRQAQMRDEPVPDISNPAQDAQQSFRPLTADTFDFQASSSSSISERPRTHTRSPPMDRGPGDLFWDESEITGHNPDDPNDDGYGINGIGFKATPAQAWERSQKRKRQLADLKSREAREARERRSERRKTPSDTFMPSKGSTGGADGKTARVRFKDG